jgi:hypothetical protein
MRTGLGRFLFLAHAMCVLFGRWRGSIISAINASPASQEQKTQMLNLVNVIDGSCAAVDAIRTVWET